MAVRSTQFGAGETMVVTDETMLQTGYIFHERIIKTSLWA